MPQTSSASVPGIAASAPIRASRPIRSQQASPIATTASTGTATTMVSASMPARPPRSRAIGRPKSWMTICACAHGRNADTSSAAAATIVAKIQGAPRRAGPAASVDAGSGAVPPGGG